MRALSLRRFLRGRGLWGGLFGGFFGALLRLCFGFVFLFERCFPGRGCAGGAAVSVAGEPISLVGVFYDCKALGAVYFGYRRATFEHASDFVAGFAVVFVGNTGFFVGFVAD